jgi:hypothetical protein
MTTAARDRPPRTASRTTALTFVALGVLTAVELRTAALDLTDPMRATALCGLLIVKVAVVMVFCLRADLRRRSVARLALAALAMAGVFAAVLMLEAAFQARVR